MHSMRQSEDKMTVIFHKCHIHAKVVEVEVFSVPGALTQEHSVISCTDYSRVPVYFTEEGV